MDIVIKASDVKVRKTTPAWAKTKVVPSKKVYARKDKRARKDLEPERPQE